MIMKMTFRIVLGLTLCAAAAPGLSAMQTINSVTCGRAACARPLELVNGESVTISLSGQGLAALTAGVVTDRSGRPIQGVSVALGDLPSAVRIRSLTTTRDVTLTAQGVGALSDLQLRFTTSRRGSVTAPIELSVAAATTAAMPVAPRDPSVLPPSRDPNRTLTTVEGSLPTVSSATPSMVDLYAGSSRIVTLRGTNLNRLDNATVVHNASPVDNVTATLQPPSDRNGLQREITLTAGAPASPPWNEPLELVASSLVPRGSVTIPVQVRVRVTVTVQPVVTVAPDPDVIRLHHDDLFRPAFESALAGVSARFRSCGSPDEHRFNIIVPAVGYSASGDIPRFERKISYMSSDWIAFGEDHTLDPSDLITGEITDIPNSAHPSPIAHSVDEVRICLVPAISKPWRLIRGEMRDGAPHLIVSATFDRLLFKARGMPAHTTGVSGSAVIRWGTVITDAELPDYEWSSPVYEILLPVEVSGGRITYGSPRSGGTMRASTRWSSQFLGPSGLRDRMADYTRERVDQIGEEIRKVFAAAGTRNQVSRLVMSRLENAHGIAQVLGVEFSSDGMWEIRPQPE